METCLHESILGKIALIEDTVKALIGSVPPGFLEQLGDDGLRKGNEHGTAMRLYQAHVWAEEMYAKGKPSIIKKGMFGVRKARIQPHELEDRGKWKQQSTAQWRLACTDT